MRFAYVYKTSDGVRQQGVVNAPTREGAFALLRERGIRPIKVVAEDGSKANGETRFVTRKRFLFIALALGILIGIGIVVFSTQLKEDVDRIGRYHEGMGEKMSALENRANEIVAAHTQRLEVTSLAVLADYAAIQASTNETQFANAIRSGYHEINGARKDLRNVFRILYDLIPPQYANERTDAKKIYGSAMERIDLTEERLTQSEKAYRLLESNLGTWTVQDGKVVFSDSILADEFTYLLHPPESSESRWSRDFERTTGDRK